MELTLEELKALLAVLDEGGAAEFEYKDEKQEVRVVMARGAPVVHSTPSLAAVPGAASGPPPAPAASTEEGDGKTVFITSPFVGTFYRAPAPGAEPFVEVGATLRPGQALCIVEAMKLMNEIEAEFPCVVVEVLVENATSVEFGQKLFKVKKS